MFVYRSLSKGLIPFSDNEDFEQELKDNLPEEFMVFRSISQYEWQTENSIINKCRSASDFFNNISDNKIVKILTGLFKREKIDRKIVETDLEEAIVYQNNFTTSMVSMIGTNR